MDKALKNTIIFGILIISISTVYHFVYSPYKRNYDLNQCLVNSEGTLTQKNQEITGHISDLEKERVIIQEEADKKFDEFLKNNPEPKFRLLPMNTNSRYATYEELKKSVDWKDNLNVTAKWLSDRNAIFDTVRDIENQIQSIGSDFEKVEKEKKSGDDTCYKKFKIII